MTNAELLALAEALPKLDPFKFDANVIYAISKNLKRSTVPARAIMRQQGEILKKHRNGDAELKKDSPGGIAYLEEWGNLLDAESDWVPHKIKLSDLKLGDGTDKTTLNGDRVQVGPTNAIPPSVLAALEPIITEE